MGRDVVRRKRWTYRHLGNGLGSSKVLRLGVVECPSGEYLDGCRGGLEVVDVVANGGAVVLDLED